VLAAIATTLAERRISIASVIQFDSEADPGSAELVFTTHQAPGGALLSAIEEIRQQDSVIEIGNILPMAG
jgi:predicted regulator of amino acid metabolism with ACT domain